MDINGRASFVYRESNELLIRERDRNKADLAPWKFLDSGGVNFLEIARFRFPRIEARQFWCQLENRRGSV